MAGYSPLKITGMTTGLVQERENFILPDDAYPILQNAYVWRERIKRKQGYQLLGRLERTIATTTVGNTNGAGTFTGNLLSILGLESTGSLVQGQLQVVIGGVTYIEPTPPNGTLVNGVTVFGSVNWATGVISITTPNVLTPVDVTFIYYPGLPVMGIRTRELQNSENDQTVFFDQKYAYIFNTSFGTFQEFIPGTTWNAHGASISGTDFFWSTNYYLSDLTNFSTENVKLFWVTNNTGQFGALADPIRVTDGTTWLDFSPPTYGQIDVTNFLVQCLSFLPFRSRLVTFNTYEGSSYATARNFSNRIRWSKIGSPFTPFFTAPPHSGLVSTGAWRSDIRGQGGFLDIPTSEDIIAVGFIRDNLVVYCERSTWQLRYTGRSIAPFQIERVNSELGAQSPFSAVQFDTSLVGIGDKGIVECDSYKSERIDVKIPDFVFQLQGQNSATFRVHGVRDFINRLAFWTCPIAALYAPEITNTFPNQRLVYNYENDSWALFNDSLTTLGTYQSPSNRTWLNTHLPWIKCNFPWINQLESVPSIVGGNQQGFIEYLDKLTTNDVSLYISAITADGEHPTIITSPSHNMSTGFVIGISGIPGSSYSDLNGGIFGIIVLDSNRFQLMRFNDESGQFDIAQLNAAGQVYIGGGLINIRENFFITSKKFNFLDEGQSIQLGYIDILMVATGTKNPGAISMNVYLDYNDSSPSNKVPDNVINDSNSDTPDTFFNSIIPTTTSFLNGVGGTKFWQRVFCPTRANFLTLQYTLSNAQMAGIEQQQDVQIDAQVLWIRKAGRMTQI